MTRPWTPLPIGLAYAPFENRNYVTRVLCLELRSYGC